MGHTKISVKRNDGFQEQPNNHQILHMPEQKGQQDVRGAVGPESLMMERERVELNF